MDNVVVLGLVKTTDPDGTPRSVEAIEEDIQLYKDHVPAISGVYIDGVIPVDYGNPSSNINSYRDLETWLPSAVTTSTTPTKISLPIFTPESDGSDKTEKPGATVWTEGPAKPCTELHFDSVAGCGGRVSGGQST